MFRSWIANSSYSLSRKLLACSKILPYDSPMIELIDIKKPAARWELIKAALRARGSSLSAVAREMGLTRSTVHCVQYHRYPSVEAAIAKLLDVTPQELWPDRYHADGTPVRQRPTAPMAKPQLRKGAQANSSIAARDGGKRS